MADFVDRLSVKRKILSYSPLPIPPFQRGVRGDGEGLGVRAVAVG